MLYSSVLSLFLLLLLPLKVKSIFLEFLVTVPPLSFPRGLWRSGLGRQIEAASVVGAAVGLGTKAGGRNSLPYVLCRQQKMPDVRLIFASDKFVLLAWRQTLSLREMCSSNYQGVNSIEFQQTVQHDSQQSI